LVAFGTFGFFFLLFVAAAIIATEVQYEKGTGATLTLVGTVLVVHFVSGWNLIALLQNHFLWFLGGAVLYIVVGGIWSLAKIGIVAGRIDSQYRRLRNDFCTEFHIKNGNGEKISNENERTRNEWERRLTRASIDIDENDGSPTFDHRKHWETVYMWIGHWPFSMLGTLCNDFVRQIIDTLYAKLDATYGKIVKSILGKHAGDMMTYEQKQAVATANGGSADTDRGDFSNRPRRQ